MLDFAACELVHLEGAGALAVHVEPAAIALGRDKHAIVAALDHFGEVCVELDHDSPTLELRRAEIPASGFRRLRKKHPEIAELLRENCGLLWRFN